MSSIQSNGGTAGDGAVSSDQARPPAARAKKRRRDGGLDFFSPEFDAARALHTAGLKPPLGVAPLSSWTEAAALAQVDVYDDLFQTEAQTTTEHPARAAGASASSSAAAAAAGSDAVAVPSPLPVPPVGTSAASWPSGDGSSLLDTLDDSRFDDYATEPKSAPAATPVSTARAPGVRPIAPPPTPPPAAAAGASSSVSLIAASPVAPVPTGAAVGGGAGTGTGAAPAPAPLGVVSRMSAEQVRINRDKAAKKAQENAERRDKSRHFMERFNTNFPVPKPISTHTQKAKAAEGPMSLLRSFHARRLRVHITIRRSHGLRSVLSAYLSAFDKHWNLLLLDVDEHYTEWEWRICGRDTVDTLHKQGVQFQLPGRRHDKNNARVAADTTAAAAAASASAAPGASAAAPSAPLLPTPHPSHIRVEMFKQRHVNQLYVRGDSVVSVCQFAPTLRRTTADS